MAPPVLPSARAGAARAGAAPWATRLGRAGGGLLDAALLALIAAGLGARALALPGYVPTSGDEWGNTLAPLRMWAESGNPGTFFHPSLYYGVTAVAYAVVAWGARLSGAVAPGTAIDLFVAEPQWLVYTARAVSLAGAALAMWGLYAFGRWLWTRRAGLLAAALLAVVPVQAAHAIAARVDALFVALFVLAAHQVVRLLDEPAANRRAGVLLGLASGANYNGALLAPWLVAAHALRDGRAAWRPAARALVVAALVGLATSPFLLLDLPTARLYIGFILGLSTGAHAGMEGRGVWFYAEELARATPLLAATVALAALAVAGWGTRRERFALSIPVGYFLVFSAVSTKFDRFILPGEALFLLIAGGLPVIAARVLPPRWPARLGRLAATALLLACLVDLTPRAIPLPPSPALPSAQGLVLDWIAAHAAPRSTVLVESGVAPLLDIVTAPDRLAAAVHASLVRQRPSLDHTYLSAIIIGSQQHYGAEVLDRQGIDYVVVSRRNQHGMRQRCAAFPDVCAFYDALEARGQLVFETPDEIEAARIYALRAP